MVSRKYLSEQELHEILMKSDSEDECLLGNADQSSDEEEVALSSPDEEENTDAGSSTPLPKRKFSEFNWNKGDLKPIIHDFSTDQSGCLDENLISHPNILNSFTLFFSEELVQNISLQVNNFQNYSQQQGNIGDHSRITKWTETNMAEIYCFLAVSLLMPQVKKSKINDYWSTDIFLSTPIFSQIMSRDRYLILLKMLHFSDNNNVDKEDSLFKLRMIIDHLKSTYKRLLYPFRNVCIDESLMLFKGRLSFKQFIPSKRHRFGIKLFLLCDCETGYILDFIIYTGAKTEIKSFDEELGKSGNIVYTLMEPYLNKGHILFVDNWYTSPILFARLHADKTNACGTVKGNRKYMPPMKEALKKGEVVSYKTTNMLAIKWVDKREVRMLSTLHSNDMKSTGKKTKEDVPIEKPNCIVDYNANMGAVDRTDMLLSTTESVRKSIKWYKKLFFHLLDTSLLNAHVLYKMTSGDNISLINFQLALVKQIVTKYQQEKPRASSSKRPEDGHSPLRLIDRHFVSMYEATDKNKRPPVRRCVVCAKHKIRRETRYTCAKCDVPLCVVPCFQKYHTVKDF